MITVDQLTLINLVPRSHHGCCVLAAICFTTGTNYFDVEEVVQREQPRFRPEVKGQGGVQTDKLFGKSRRLFGHTFTKLNEPVMELRAFLRRHPTGTFVVRRKRHAFVVKDGKVYDWRDDAGRYDVLDAWSVEKA